MLPPYRKEAQFFNLPTAYARGEAWYRAHFPTEDELRSAARSLGYRPVTGEATPAMSAPAYARNAARHVAHAKLIVSLRNPVDRAWSHYQHYRRHPYPDHRSFEKALEQELQLLESGVELTEDNLDELGPALQRHGYIRRGQYAEQLEQWFAYFPRRQFLFLNFDSWTREPERAAERIVEHIGLPKFSFVAERANAGRYRSSMPASCRSLLTEHFRPWNRRLFELLELDWGWPC
jgi:hypothetical protein